MDSLQLALESSTRHASVCLLNGSNVIAERTAPESQPSTAWMIPAIRQLLETAGIGPESVEQITVSNGPGSFTGLRLAVTAAKVFSWATGCRIASVSTHHVLAFKYRLNLSAIEVGNLPNSNPLPNSLPNSNLKLATVIDAQRGQWFAAVHDLSFGNRKPAVKNEELGGYSELVNLQTTHPSSIVSPADFIQQLPKATHLTGPGLKRHKSKLIWPNHLVVDPFNADETNAIPDARSTGLLAHQMPNLVSDCDAFQFSPNYGRMSAAEEKKAAATQDK